MLPVISNPVSLSNNMVPTVIPVQSSNKSYNIYPAGGGLPERVTSSGGGSYNVYPSTGGLPERIVPNGGGIGGNGQAPVLVPIIAP
jgi:hypothetical protein